MFLEPRHVPSVLSQGKRVRAVRDQLHLRPIDETFHQFLTCVVQWTLGKSWWLQQASMNSAQRHVAFRWYEAWIEFCRQDREADADGIVRTVAPGPVQALLTLGYDLFWLQGKNALPERVVERLRKHQYFQSARYELAVASIMMRAGFSIDFLEDDEWDEKHCEFIAKHPSGFFAGVEAKSRVRPGALNEAGEFIYGSDGRGLLKLAKKGAKQGMNGAAHIVFLDVNAPAALEATVEHLAWKADIEHVFDAMQRGSKPTRWSLLAATNYAGHLGGVDTPSPPGECALLWSDAPEVPVPATIRESVLMAIGQYQQVPTEV